MLGPARDPALTHALAKIVAVTGVKLVEDAVQVAQIALEMAEQIVATPAVSVKLARLVVSHLSRPQIRASMDDEMIYQTFVSRSDDAAERRAAQSEDRPPHYTGS